MSITNGRRMQSWVHMLIIKWWKSKLTVIQRTAHRISLQREGHGFLPKACEYIVGTVSGNVLYPVGPVQREVSTRDQSTIVVWTKSKDPKRSLGHQSSLKVAPKPLHWCWTRSVSRHLVPQSDDRFCSIEPKWCEDWLHGLQCDLETVDKPSDPWE